MRAAWLIGILAACTDGATYYVDPSGDDTNTGRSPQSAWRTLDRVNAATFVPGDRLLFRAGASWGGELWPKGNGSDKSPIVVSRYGDGAAPQILGGGATAAVYLENQSYWVIRDLEVTNCISPCDSLDDLATARSTLVGIMVVASANEPVRSVTVASNYVHDVAGNFAQFGTGIDSNYADNGGISFAAVDGSTFENATIVDNSISDVDRIGIFVGRGWGTATSADEVTTLLPRSRDTVITGNTIDRSGADGILNYLTTNTLVQRNVVSNGGLRGTASAGIWSAASDHTIVEHNEVYGEVYGIGGGLDRDRMAFDVDWGTTDHVVRYNYSHDNYGGFLEVWESNGLPGSVQTRVDGLVVEFNISINDGVDASTHIFTECGTSWSAGRPPTLLNNTVAIDETRSTAMFGRCRQTSAAGAPIIGGALLVTDNIFYAAGETSYAVMPDATFAGNAFYAAAGVLNDPAGGLHDDPLFAHTPPGIADDVQLRVNSPALTGGTCTDPGRVDYWGNRVTGSPRGAYGGN